ncbi:alfa-L-rhamnosidase [Lachnospiraceae bacterium KM106-2]|nr:alfa-L-rhamnosidase [Lachnospiraceae bacterium KM106-2]
MKIVNLLTNNIKNPIGYRLDDLHLSWKVMESKGVHAKVVRIVISKDPNLQHIIFDSGCLYDYIQSSYDLKLNLEPRTRYYWKVTVSSDAGDEACSDIVWFETGKLEEPWQAKWITTEETDRMPIFCKNFTLDHEVGKARIYLCGLGLYELSINGKKVGEEYLMPGYHSYDCFLQYQVMDITGYLWQGRNKISIVLGEGWYKGRFGFEGGFTNLYGDKKKCIAQLEITDMNGESLQILTDETWEVFESSILQNGIYDGETIDNTLERKGGSVTVLNDDTKCLEERTNPRIVKKGKFKPVKIIPKAGYQIVDFGESITGWVELNGSFQENQTIKISYSEVLQDNDFYRDNLRTAKAEFICTCNGEETQIRPHFTFYGFRYIKVEGIEQIDEVKIYAYRLMSDLETTGSLITSNKKVNQLFENTLRSQAGNFLDIPTDCPQRDERMGWTGDAGIFSPTACFHMDSKAFFSNYLRNLQEEQQKINGSIPFFVPKPKVSPREGINPFYIDDGVAIWGDAATILPWTLYEYYGDAKLLKAQYPIMTAWVDYVTRRSMENENPYLWQNDRQLGDWLALDNGNIHNPIGKTDSNMIASAYYYRSVQFCEKAAGVIGDCRRNDFKQLENNIRKAFLSYYFDEEGNYKGELTQTACALLLTFQLYPKDTKEKLVTSLRNLMELNDNKLNTGFVGTPLLPIALSENGMNHMAYELLLNEQYPGWLFEVNLGATTIWERWNSLLEDGTISGTEMNSLNHYAYGSIANWMYRYLCGFHPSMGEPVKMTIRPKPDPLIPTVSGSWDSPYGVYQCSWNYEDKNKVCYKIKIPFNGNARVILSDEKEFYLEAGSYKIKEGKVYEG